MSALKRDGDLLDSVCILDAGMCEYLAFTGQLADILLADAAAVYSFPDALSLLGAKSMIKKARRIVFFLSWFSFESKSAIRSIVAEGVACQDVCIYSGVLLQEGDTMMHGLDYTCQYLPYSGRAYELQDVELLTLPATATCIDTAPFHDMCDEVPELLGAQLAELCVSRCWKPQFRVVNEFCDQVVQSARTRIDKHSASASDEKQDCFIVVMDRLADIRSALQHGECVLQKAMDHSEGGTSSIRPSLEEILMWAKGSESLRAYAHGLDALLERRFEDASREVADMDTQNSFSLKGVREGAQAILESARECPLQKESPFRSTISTMMKVAQESGQEEEVYQQLLELNAQPNCDLLTLFEACCSVACSMSERWDPCQDLKDAFDRRLEGTFLQKGDFFWNAVRYCCSSRSRIVGCCDSSQTLISFLLDKVVKEDDTMKSMHLSNAGSLGSFVSGVFSGLTRGLADWKPSQCSVICLVVLGGITPDEIRCVKQYGSKLSDQTLVLVSNSITSRLSLFEKCQEKS